MVDIVIDIELCFSNPTGMGRFARETLNELAALDTSTQYHLFHSSDYHTDDYSKLSTLPGNFRVVRLPFSRKTLRILGLLGRGSRFVERFFPGRVDHYFSPGSVMLPIRARRIGMIHDLNVFDHPLENRLRSALIDRLTHASLARRADVILTVSEFSRQRILNQWRLPADRVKVVYCGVSSNFQDGCSGCRQHAAVRDKYGIGGEYFLWYGTMGKRKNVPALIRAFHEFRRRTGSSALVVLAGTSGNDSANVQRLIASFQLEQAVRNLGYVPDAELYTLLKGAIALVFPSLYEGFGLPVLEAMACGTPVIAANRTSLPEVIGGAGLLVDPLDTTSMARAMDALEEHLDLRRELSGRGKAQAAGFTWRNTAERLLTIFGAASSA